MIQNEFVVESLPDGRIKITSPGGFAKEIHANADEFLEYMKNLAGGSCETKTLKAGLQSPQHQHGKQQHHHKH